MSALKVGDECMVIAGPNAGKIVTLERYVPNGEIIDIYVANYEGYLVSSKSHLFVGVMTQKVNAFLGLPLGLSYEATLHLKKLVPLTPEERAEDLYILDNIQEISYG